MTRPQSRHEGSDVPHALLLDALLEAAETPVFAVDRAYRYLFFNRAHAAAMQSLYGAEIQLGRSLAEYQTVAADWAIAKANLDRALAGETLIDAAYSGDATRERRYFEVTHRPIRTPQGEIVGVLVLARDATERKRMEERYQETLAILETSLEQSQVGVAIADAPSGTLRYVNETGLAIMGEETPAAVRGVGVDRYTLRWTMRDIGGKPLALDQIPLARAVRYGERCSTEAILCRPDGSERRIAINAAPIPGPDGVPTAAIALFMDITEMRETEAALRVNEERLRLALAAAGQGLYDFNIQTGEVIVNEGYARMLGYAPEEFHETEEFWRARIHPDDRARVERALSDYIAGRTNEYRVEARQRTKSGEWKWILSLGKVLTWDELGRPLRMLGTYTDIDARKRAEEEILRRETRFRVLIENSADGVVLVDATGHFTYFSPTALRILGCNSADEAPVRTGEISHPEDRAWVLAAVDALYKQPGHVITLQYRIRHRSGDWRWVESTISNQLHEPSVAALVVNVRDITERKRAEEALRESYQQLETALHELRAAQNQLVQQERLAAVGQLTAGIAHDFNNILAVIILHIQMALRTPDLSPRLRTDLQTVAEHARRAAELVQQMLDFGRRAVLQMRPLDLVPFLRQQVEILRRTIPERVRILCEIQVASGACVVSADPTRLQQVLTNLALNAHDALPAGGELYITLDRLQVSTDEPAPFTAAETGAWARIRVRDTGTGIPATVLPHIFEPFFTTKEPGKGTGLGLAQVYGILKQHNGHITVDTVEGRGTTFTLYLPLISTPGEESTLEEAPLLLRGNGETILVVEDDHHLREVLVEALASLLNYRPLAAANGRAALTLLRDHAGSISLILTDLVMPEMGGQELLRTLRAQGSHIPAVVMSGHPLEAELQLLESLGVVGWLLKPPDFEQLARLLAQALQGPPRP